MKIRMEIVRKMVVKFMFMKKMEKLTMATMDIHF